MREGVAGVTFGTEAPRATPGRLADRELAVH